MRDLKGGGGVEQTGVRVVQLQTSVRSLPTDVNLPARVREDDQQA